MARLRLNRRRRFQKRQRQPPAPPQPQPPPKPQPPPSPEQPIPRPQPPPQQQLTPPQQLQSRETRMARLRLIRRRRFQKRQSQPPTPPQPRPPAKPLPPPPKSASPSPQPPDANSDKWAAPALIPSGCLSSPNSSLNESPTPTSPLTASNSDPHPPINYLIPLNLTLSPLIDDFPQSTHYPLYDPTTPLSPIPTLSRKPLFVNTNLPNPISPIQIPTLNEPPD